MQELREEILDYAYKLYTTQQTNECSTCSENFITGRVGYLFYLLQLYQISGDREVGKSMEEALDNYEHFIKDIPTNNYTLTGRLGLGYYYLELFSITREKKYVDKALDMARVYYDGYSFQYGIINGSSLFEGVAGILAFTQQLYLETKEPWLLPYIEKWVIYLTTAAISTQNGIHWGGLTDRRKRNAGVITGAAGIAFVLGRAGKCFDNDLLTKIAKKALEYESTCRLQNVTITHEIKDYSLGYGIAGVLLVNLYNYGVADEQLMNRLLIFLQWWQQQDVNAFNTDAVHSFFNGLPGIGFLFLEAYNITNEKKYWHAAVSIANQLLEAAGNNNQAIPYTFEGWLGTGSFWLMMLDNTTGKPGNFFMPASRFKIDPEILPDRSVFKPKNHEIYLAFIRSHFKSTLKILQQQFSDELNTWLDKPYNVDLDKFILFTKRVIGQNSNNPETASLCFNFEKEQFAYSVTRSITARLPEDEPALTQIDAILRRPRTEFCSIKLALSDNVWFFSKESPLQFNGPFVKESFTEFIRDYGSRTVCYRLSEDDTLHETMPGILKFIVDWFGNAITVSEAQDKMIHFFIHRDEGSLGLLRDYFGVRDNEQLKQVISGMVQDGIRYTLMEGILELKSA